MEKVRDYVGACWRAALRMLPVGLRDLLRQKQLWWDIRQEVALCAFIAERDQFDLKETSRFTQREIYRALREMGFRRQGKSGFEVDEVVETEYVGDPEENKSLFERVDSVPHYRVHAVIVVESGEI